ncbi:MAG: hypothetical protein HXX80_00675 [Nitrososphaerales archaeon]|nr:hypothetical protein [Nitrososphaerales archaeon]
MPEICLPYGSTEVFLNIKAENLAEVIEPSLQKIDDRALYEKLNSIDVEQGSVVLLSDVTSATLKALNSFIDLQTEKGRQEAIKIAVKKSHLKSVKRALEGKSVDLTTIGEPTEDAGIADGFQVKIPRVFSEHKRIIISEVSFDPLFGFGGGPVSFIKAVDPRLVAEAFKRRLDNNPNPGLDTNANWFASRVAEEAGEFTSIEVLNSRGEICHVFLGNMIDAHSGASKKLYESARKDLKQPASAIFVGLGDPSKSLALSSSIKYLWNVTSSLEKKGSVIFLAECSEGLGSQSLKHYATGRLNLNELVKRGEYAEGLEDLIYLQNALQIYNIFLVSTLPNYYSGTKLGFRVAKKASDALDHVLRHHGRKVKLYVVTDVSNILLTLSQ